MTLSVQALLAEARTRSGIERDDPDAIEPLTRLVDSLNAESELHPEGERGMTGYLVRTLANRLRLARDFAAHPEISDEVITALIVICGMGRTGSTKTHKMLAASGDFNWLPYWQVLNPALFTGDRGESPQARIDDCEAYASWFDRMSPEAKYGHSFVTHEPEEESFLLAHSLKTPVMMGWSPIPSYLGWLLSEDMSAQFAMLRRCLQYLQWQGLSDRSKPWLLKSPLYSGMEPLLLAAFPDARLLMTHRHPRDTMPSGLRLLETFHAPFTRKRPDPLGYVAGQAGAIAAHLQIRAALPPGRFCDIAFREVVGPVRSLAEKIYGYCGISCPAASIARIEAWYAANPQGKHGSHSYTLAQFGLSETLIAVQFAGYIAFLDQLPQ